MEPTEIYDAQGKLLGVFVPANLERAKEMYAKLEALVERDREEIASRGDGSPQFLHADVLARLKELQHEIQRRNAAGEAPMTKDEARKFVSAGLSPISSPPNRESMQS